ncbi:MAG: flavin-containing monooxygenase, partial [Gammaproteobacteria bacterium]
MTQTSSSADNQYDAVIVGAGIAGLYAVYRLREMGLKFLAIDAATDVGGTWYWNCYPGARVDSQSYVYQYWFSPELIEEWNWGERFPAQPETESYLKFVADKMDLRKHIRFNTRVDSADWDDASQRWTITTDQGDKIDARFFFSCAGMLSAPLRPPFPGEDQYQGTIVHTARYPREGIDLKGKRVGVVGTGATGIQVIQTIASEVSELKVFQRTAQYGMAMKNYRYSDEERNEHKARAAEYAKTVQTTFT